MTPFPRVLIVGSEGFIGTRLQHRQPEWDGIDLKFGADFADLDNYDYDFLVLLAARTDSTIEGYLHNMKIYNKLVEMVAAVGDKMPHVIFTSSAAIYAADGAGAHCEDELGDPPTLYGKSKMLGEHILFVNCPRATVLRLSNVYGYGDGNGVIDNFINGGKTIYGNGEQVRDYVHVNVVTEAISRIVDNGEKYANDVFNISSHEGRTVDEVFAQYGGGTPEYADEREGDVAHSVLCNAYAKELELL